MATENGHAVELLYWPRAGGCGRGEFIRLVLEEYSISYVDKVSDLSDEEGGGVGGLIGLIRSNGEGENIHPMSPPCIRVVEDGKPVIFAQTAACCLFLIEKFQLPGFDDSILKAHIMQLMLSAGDLGDEAHNTHHPIATALYYEDQKEPAKEFTKHFLETRIPKYLGYFETILRFFFSLLLS